MGLYERVESLWLHNNRGLSFQGFVEEYMMMTFGTGDIHSEYVGDEFGEEIYIGNVGFMYKLDIENQKLDIVVEV